MHVQMRLIAHRGYSALYPENTMEAYSKAFESGAFAVEADIRLTADAIPVCFRDATLKRLAGVDKCVSGCTLSEMRSHLSPHHLCLLEQLLQYAVQSSTRRVLLDIHDVAALPIVARLIRNIPVHKQVTVGLRKLAHVKAFRKLDTTTPVLGLLSDYTKFTELFTYQKTYPCFWEHDLLADPLLTRLAAGRPMWIAAGAPAESLCGKTTPDNLRSLSKLNPYVVMVKDPEILHKRNMFGGAQRRRGMAA